MHLEVLNFTFVFCNSVTIIALLPYLLVHVIYFSVVREMAFDYQSHTVDGFIFMGTNFHGLNKNDI